MMQLRLPTFGTAIALATLLPSLVSAQTERRNLSGSSVAVYNVAGRMTVEQGSGSDVVVEVTFRGRDASRLRLETGDVRGVNALRVIYPNEDIVYSDAGFRRGSATFDVDNDYTWGSTDNTRSGDRRRVRVKSSGNGVEAWADIRIMVPNGRALDANLAVGELSANNVDADLSLDVASAKVSATAIRGNLDIDAGSGGIDVRDANVSDLNLDTGSGSVRLNGITSRRCSVDTGSGGVTADNVSCDNVDIDVGSGSIRLDRVRAPDVRVESGSGGVDISLTSAFRSLNIETGSGSVTIAMPENIGANVQISTGSGSIDSDFPVQMNRIERHAMRGRIGNGDATIQVDTGSGGVRLVKAR
jgi:DUF4097 and DUF4098 domain-containing protein YvlB